MLTFARFLLSCASFALLAALLSAPQTSYSVSAAKPDVKNRWIISLKASEAKGRVWATLQKYKKSKPSETNFFDRNYTVIHGFAGKLSPGFIKQLRKTHAADLKHLEPDGVVNITGTQSFPRSWGLTRISQRNLNLSAPYYYNDLAGSGVTVYVIDSECLFLVPNFKFAGSKARTIFIFRLYCSHFWPTQKNAAGIQFTHTDFGGRASLVKDFYPITAPDGNGHGTHVAGTIGATTWGVAKRVTIKGIRALNEQGSSTWSTIVAAIDYVGGVATAYKSVLNMSFGGGTNQAVNDAVNALFNRGVAVIAAAGNNGGDACTISPAGAVGAFAVGATDKSDMRGSYSNFGKCVKVRRNRSKISSRDSACSSPRKRHHTLSDLPLSPFPLLLSYSPPEPTSPPSGRASTAPPTPSPAPPCRPRTSPESQP